MEITTVLSNSDFTLRRIVLDIPIEGFQDFITPWLITEDSPRRNILVDPGPACGVSSLRSSLRDLGVDRLDLVLLTHIHIDHAGGVGHLLQTFSDAKVAVHPKGVRHLADPSRLWSSTAETLGKDVAHAYGEIVPVQPQKILPTDVSPEGIDIVDTPGHSQHHQCYIYRSCSGDLIFEGEAAGVYLGQGYLRPATPPRFFYDTSARSIRALEERADSATFILYGHYGYSKAARNLLGASLRQLSLWKDVTEGVIKEAPERPLEDMVGASVERLLKADSLLAGLKHLPADIKARETYFLHNSARGFISSQLESALPR